MHTEQLNPAHYTYRVFWSAEDNEYVGTCVEFGPMLSWLAPTQHEALSGIEEAVTEAIEDMRETGETPPTPIADQHYSGRFNVRIPESLHRQLAMEAAEQQISLNRLVSDRLART
jgi:predicted HicB family RNase H-like nuclease